MSISDIIVVMKDGVLQQMGKPQEVYDNPVNLFVAKFLGTPPINVFEGEIKSGKVCIGNDAVLDASGISDKKVYVAIRPEGFNLDNEGTFECKLNRIEVMGRDVSIVSTHDNLLNDSGTIRSIINAENDVDTSKETVRFSLKKNKVFIFDADTEERIDY